MSTHPPVTLQRIEAWLTSTGLVFEHDDGGGIVLVFPNSYFGISTQSGSALVLVHGFWRGAFASGQVEELYDLAEQYHRSTFGPRVSVHVSEEDAQAALGTQMVGFAGEGMSDAQLADYLDLALSMNMTFFADLEERYPALVTWEES